MHISEHGLSLIARFEGKRLTAYRDSVGVLTIGYGHTTAAGLPVVTEGLTITNQQAIDLLRSDVVKYENAVLRVVKTTPSQNQFDAMVSLCYNIGPGNFGGSTVVSDFNAGDLAGAALAFTHWCKAGGQTLPGLVARRNSEKAVFETQDIPSQSASQPAPVPAGLNMPPLPIPTAKPAPTAPVGLLALILNILLILFKKG